MIDILITSILLLLYMNFTHYDLGTKERGTVVEITLSGSAANVRLMDSNNFQNYRNSKPHRYFGGLAKSSPVRLQVPNTGRWHITIDMQGLRGTVRSSLRIVPSALPELRTIPLANVPSLVHHDTPQSKRKYDVFISHASEDKDSFVRPLARALQNQGLSVWYDEFELKIGDSLRRKIDIGVANSRFGIVVLSPSFINKGWTNYELDGIVTNSLNGKQSILPIWHNITKQQVIDYSPSLADKVARNTTNSTIEEISLEIADLISY